MYLVLAPQQPLQPHPIPIYATRELVTLPCKSSPRQLLRYITAGMKISLTVGALLKKKQALVVFLRIDYSMHRDYLFNALHCYYALILQCTLLLAKLYESIDCYNAWH